MPNTPRQPGTYYDREREERLRYQKEHYALRKASLARGRELMRELDPEKHQRYLDYQRAYHRKRRAAAKAAKDTGTRNQGPV